jgi:hypothetical protein
MAVLSLSSIEAEVIAMILSGDHETLALLRQQAGSMLVGSREGTTAGFFTKFIHVGDGPLLRIRRQRLVLGDVEATISGLQFGAGFLLFVVDGLLYQL